MRRTKEEIFDDLDEEATGDYKRKGEVDRKMLLKGSSIMEGLGGRKKNLKKVLFKNEKSASNTADESNIFGKL